MLKTTVIIVHKLNKKEKITFSPIKNGLMLSRHLFGPYDPRNNKFLIVHLRFF